MDARKRIVELGIWQGGRRCSHLDRFFSPQKLLAVDFNPLPIAALDEYALTHNSVRPY